MAGTTGNDPNCALKWPNCGLFTQHNLLGLKKRLKDRAHLDFYCVACGYSRLLTTDFGQPKNEAAGFIAGTMAALRGY